MNTNIKNRFQRLLRLNSAFNHSRFGVPEQEVEHFVNQLLRLLGYVKNIVFASNNQVDLTNR